jgi:hypothetical protein
MRYRLAPDVDLADFVHGHIADADTRAARVQQLRDDAVDGHHAEHEMVGYD